MIQRRTVRANRKSPKERATERAVRERIQKEKPTLEGLMQSGECAPDAVMTMGMYFDVQNAVQALKRERVRQGLSITDVAERSGLDRAVVSRLEGGKQDNPTVATLMRYADAIGMRFLWTYKNSPSKARANGKSSGRPMKSRR